MPTEPNPPKVFISYSHDSRLHLDRVLELADRLRAEGIDCNLDQYEPAPAEGWPRWMDKQFQDADFILVVCTETYCRRFEGREEHGKGQGVKWEGAIITDELYSNESVNKRFIPVLFSDDDTVHVPRKLQHYMRYLLADDGGYEELYRRLTYQPRVIKPPLGKLRSFEPVNKLHALSSEDRQQDFTPIEENMPLESIVPIQQDADIIQIKSPNKPDKQPTSNGPVRSSASAEQISINLEMKHARVTNLVSTISGPEKVEGIPVEFFRLAAAGTQIRPDPYVENLSSNVILDMIPLPGGMFQMGSNEYIREMPIHEVTVSPFAISKFQITQAQWQAVMGKNLSFFKGDELPVESISWNDARAFCEKLSKMTSKTFRLPTEAEWEYACRAGSTTRYCFGDNDAPLGEYAWYKQNSDDKTHPVGEKKPNAWGMYDMHGNIWEWCQDWFDETYYKQSPEKDPQGPASGTFRILRGGSWDGNSDYCRTAIRNNVTPDLGNIDIGFRVVCVARAL